MIVNRLRRLYPNCAAEDRTIAIDTLLMLTSFETFDDLKQEGRGSEQVIEIIEKLVRATVAVTSTV